MWNVLFHFLHNTRYRLFRVLGTDLELITNDISETARYCSYSFATFRSLTFYPISALTSYRIQLYKLRKSITERYFHEIFALLRFYAAEIRSYSSFQNTYRSHLHGSSRLGPGRSTSCSETSVTNHQSMLLKFWEERRFHLHLGGSLISRRDIFICVNKISLEMCVIFVRSFSGN